MKIVDNLIALRIIYLLVTPFEDTKAYKIGLIDSKGRPIKKAETAEEKDSTSMLHRLVWNLKRIINLAPGGSTKIGSLAAAYLLVKEGVDGNWSENRMIYEATNRFQMLMDTRLLEEEVIVEESLKQLLAMQEDAPANAAGAGVSTEAPVVDKTKKKKIPDIMKRTLP